jgi:RHS repeat-associated protein
MPVMDFNGSGSLEMRYLNGPTGDLVDTVIARESAGGTIAWYLPDRLGTVRDLINNSGSIIDHIDFSAFGTVLAQSAPSEGDRMMGFAGMELDSVTGMNLAVYRVQDPGTGRWDSQDPLGFFACDTNLYRYVTNDPANESDPQGEFWFVIPILAVGFLLFNPTELESPMGGKGMMGSAVIAATGTGGLITCYRLAKNLLNPAAPPLSGTDSRILEAFLEEAEKMGAKTFDQFLEALNNVTRRLVNGGQVLRLDGRFWGNEVFGGIRGGLGIVKCRNGAVFVVKRLSGRKGWGVIGQLR